MSLADYTSLQSSIGNWVHRSDYTSIAGDLITLFEADFNNEPENHCRQMETETSITATSGYLILPTDWVSWKIIKGSANGADYRIPDRPNEAVTDATYGEVSGTPRYAVTVGSRTYLKPPQGGVFSTVYVAALPALSNSNTTNWLLTKFPNLYLFGALAFMESFGSNDPRIGLWKSFAEDAIKKFRRDARRAKFGQNPQMMPDRTA